MMLGDVGGLLDFILIVFKPILGYLSSSCLTVSLVSKLFHTSETDRDVERRNTTPLEAFQSIQPVPFSSFQAMFSACSCKVLQKKSKRIKALRVGSASLQQSLDVVSLVRQIRILKTLTRLLLSKEEQRLISFQRREAVLSTKQKDQRSDKQDSYVASEDAVGNFDALSDVSDHKFLKMFKQGSDIELLHIYKPDGKLTYLEKLREGTIYNNW